MNFLGVWERVVLSLTGIKLRAGGNRKCFGAAFVMVISLLALPLLVHADPLRREGLVPVTGESNFFVDNATLFEPYVSLDPTAPPLELSRLLNEGMRFPTMHFILEGDRRVIGIRTLAKGPTGKKFVLTWSEDLTLLLPTPLLEDHKTKTYQASQIVGLLSAYGKEGMRTFWAFVASDGTVTVSTIDKDSLNVGVDLIFKRINVDPSVRLDEEQKHDDELINEVEKETSAYAFINFKKTFVVRRKDYQDLTFWEGRAGDVDISDRYEYCSRCFYDPEAWGMFEPESAKE